MTTLTTTPNIQDPDGFYAELLALHEGRSTVQSEALNARLVLILANHIGNRDVLREAFSLAEQTLQSAETNQLSTRKGE